MKAIQRSGLKNNSNCAFPRQWRNDVHDNVYECEFDCMFSIRIYYVLILSAWMMEFAAFFHFFALYLRFTVKCYHTDSMAVSSVRHFQCFIPYTMAHLQALNYYTYIYISERTEHTKKQNEDIWCLAIEMGTNEKESEILARKNGCSEQHYHHHHHFRFYGCEAFASFIAIQMEMHAEKSGKKGNKWMAYTYKLRNGNSVYVLRLLWI